MSNLNHRICWIDNVKAFSIIAVVLFHTNILPEIKIIAYILCMPAFFVISGIFANKRLSFLAFLERERFRLIIPFCIFGLLSWLAWFFIGRRYGVETDSIQAWWLPLLGMVCGKTEWLIQNRPLWFLCCMVCLDFIYYIIDHFSTQYIRWIICIIIACIGCILGYLGHSCLWALTPAMIMLPFYLIGVEYKEIILKTDKLSYHSLIIIICISIVGIGLCYYLNPNYNLSLGLIGNPFIFYIATTSVIGFWFTFSILLHKQIGVIMILQYIGQNTLLILCAHIPVFGMIKGIAMLCHIPLDFFETSLGCLCLWVGTFIILLPTAYFINKYCPWMVGKKNPTP